MLTGSTGLRDEFQIGELGIFFVAKKSSLAHQEHGVEFAQRGDDILRAVQPFSQKCHVGSCLELFVCRHGIGELFEIV